MNVRWNWARENKSTSFYLLLNSRKIDKKWGGGKRSISNLFGEKGKEKYFV